MEKPNPTPPQTSYFAAAALIVMGLVVIVPCGLCTGYFATAGGFLTPVAIVLGGPFVILGGGLLWLGVRMATGRAR